MSPSDPSASSAAPGPTPASSLSAHEDHLRALGLPMMLAPATRLRELLPRSAGFAAGLALLGVALAALDRSNDLAIEVMDRYDLTDVEAGGAGGAGADLPDDDTFWAELADAAEPIIELLALSIALAVLAPLLGWVVAKIARNVSRGAATALGLGSMLALVVVPVLTFTSANGPDLADTLLAAALVLVGTYLGAGSLLRWSARRVRLELGTMGPMVARVLPLVMLAVLFLFFSVELWQVMVALSWPRTFAVIGVILALTVLLVGITTRDDVRHELRERYNETPLRWTERANILLVPVLATLIQAALFAILVFAFFLFLGWTAVPETTEARWTQTPDNEPQGLMFGLPISVTLVRVALTLAAFSALNLAAAAASDAAHRARFVRPMIDEVVRGLDAREAYLVARSRQARR